MKIPSQILRSDLRFATQGIIETVNKKNDSRSEKQPQYKAQPETGNVFEMGSHRHATQKSKNQKK